MQRIYYVGIGKFGYAVFYDDRNGKPKQVSPIFRTFSAAKNYLLHKQK